MRGSHESDLAEEEIAHFTAELKETLASNQARLICYKHFKDDFPEINEVFTNCGKPPQVKSIQINTGLVIFIKINST